MNLSEALHKIAVAYGLNESELAAYVQEDTIGGWDENPANAKWICGSVWEVEGQIIYALIRALKPKLAIEVGSYYGCSAYHIAEALFRNEQGKLISIDIAFMYKVPERYAGIIEQVNISLFDYRMPSGCVDFVFEDAMHTAEMTAHVWADFKENALPGAMIVSHDAVHESVGLTVREGMARVTPDGLPLLIQPGKCGLGIWRKPV